MTEETDIFAELPDDRVDDLPELSVWVNAGFGNRSYLCRINADSTMTIPDPLVRELDLSPGDDLDFDFNVEDGTLYIAKKIQEWNVPEWLED